jgi:hypothetical protein
VAGRERAPGRCCAQAADRIRSLHEVLGITYFTFSLTPTVKWETLEKLLAALR